MTFRVGIVVGEVSGDNLAAHLIRSLRILYPDLVFEGILGPELIKEGGKTFYPMERLSVMGFVEPLARIPELFKIRRHLIQHFTQNPPAVFIGVDAPDFNLGLEAILKNHQIPIVHYVSPSVWAWRQWRIKKIIKAVDLMLTLLPFEAEFYQKHQVPVCFTGHPLADLIPLETDKMLSRKTLGLSLKSEQCIVALMPGSRHHELKNLATIFILAAKYCFERDPKLHFIAPLISEAHQEQFRAWHHALAPQVPIQIFVGKTALAISASDVVLVASGTATLEVMLYKKPMVVAYRLHPLTYHIAKRLLKVPYVSLPNLLAKEFLVPEYIQDAATPESLGQSLLEYLSPAFDVEKLKARFTVIHQQLKQGASVVAAKAIKQMLTFD